jgi:hypothetical protein
MILATGIRIIHHPSSEHCGIANAACPYVALSGLYQSAVHLFGYKMVPSNQLNSSYFEIIDINLM